MARILVIEDEAALARALQEGLRDELHAVDVESDGEDALLAARLGGYDLLLLDRMLPGLSGVEICRRLRAARDPTPILMVTARDASEDIVEGLDAGADDYITKPFAFEELLARVRALLRRSAGSGSPRHEVGLLAVEPATRRAWYDGQELALTPKEFQLLAALSRRAGAVVTRDRLTTALWEGDDAPESNAIEVHIASLRRKIERNGGSGVLQTVRGVGYTIRALSP